MLPAIQHAASTVPSLMWKLSFPQCRLGKPKGSGPHTLHASDQGRTKSFLSNLPSGSMTQRPHNLRFNSKQDRTDQHLAEYFIG